MGDALPEVNLGTGRVVLSVQAAGDRTCAILDEGSLKVGYEGSIGCWTSYSLVGGKCSGSSCSSHGRVLIE